MTERVCVIEITHIEAFIPSFDIGDHIAFKWEAVKALVVGSPITPRMQHYSPPIRSLLVVATPTCLAGFEGITCFDESDWENVSVIYFLCCSGEVVYVGKTGSLRTRIASHFESNKTFDSVFYIAVSDSELDQREGEMIDKFRPKYNRARNKSYRLPSLRNNLRVSRDSPLAHLPPILS